MNLTRALIASTTASLLLLLAGCTEKNFQDECEQDGGTYASSDGGTCLHPDGRIELK